MFFYNVITRGIGLCLKSGIPKWNSTGIFLKKLNLEIANCNYGDLALKKRFHWKSTIEFRFLGTI
jgi:hypothetical protein